MENKEKKGGLRFKIGENYYNAGELSKVSKCDLDALKAGIVKAEKNAYRLGIIGNFLKYGGAILLFVSIPTVFVVPEIGIPTVVLSVGLMKKGADKQHDSKDQYFFVKHQSGFVRRIEQAIEEAIVSLPEENSTI